jgi:hypothetical protein
MVVCRYAAESGSKKPFDLVMFSRLRSCIVWRIEEDEVGTLCCPFRDGSVLVNYIRPPDAKPCHGIKEPAAGCRANLVIGEGRIGFAKPMRMPRYELKQQTDSERTRIMIFDLKTFTFVHVALSLVGIGSGFVVMYGLLTGRRLHGWTTLFLATTVATSVTGFGFPFDHLLPSHKVGIVSLVALAVAILARYAFQLAGAWRRIYVAGAVVALYLNVFVGIVQAFQKVPALKALAPTQSEPSFLLTQLVVMALFIALAVFAAIRFRIQPVSTSVRTA